MAFEYLLCLELKIQKIKHDSFFKGKLPILRINDTFFEKEEFIDLLLKILCDNKKENCFPEIFLINSIRKTLSSCSQYLIWINPSVNYYFRDPYWLILNPFKKMSHFWNLKSLKDNLQYFGIKDATSVDIYNYFFIN